jgi:hypothetical protein
MRTLHAEGAFVGCAFHEATRVGMTWNEAVAQVRERARGWS